MRFAWNKLAIPNLMNAAGLPAPAFRAGELPQPKAIELTQIPEMDDYRIVYQLMIDPALNYAVNPPNYDIDNSTDSQPFTKVAYLLELQKASCEGKFFFPLIR